MRHPVPAALSVIAALAVLAGPCAAPIIAEEAPPGKPAALPPFEIRISETANIIHWIDNLAGASRGKTIRTYRRTWQQRHGPPTRAESDRLRRWGELRDKEIGPPRGEPLNASGCLPQMEESRSWRQEFIQRSYDAPSVPAFLESLRDRLDVDEIVELGEIIDLFGPRVLKIWESMGYLRKFEERFRKYLDQSELRPFLGEVARFLEVDPSAFPPGRIHLMAVPEESATFATAIGRDLMMEIRPGDGPEQQIQVIAHETTHYLWQMLSPERRDALARRVYAGSPRGPVLWELLREGLPTAIGQGLAEKRLTRRRFGFQYVWYHLAPIDHFAKEIFPVVESAMDQGKTFAEAVAAHLDRAGDGSAPARAGRDGGDSVDLRRGGAHGNDVAESHEQEGPAGYREPNAPGEYLYEGLHLIGEGMLPAYGRILQVNPVRHRWAYPIADPAGTAMLDRYACLGGLAFVGPAELADPSRLPAVIARALRLPSDKATVEAADASGAHVAASEGGSSPAQAGEETDPTREPSARATADPGAAGSSRRQVDLELSAPSGNSPLDGIEPHSTTPPPPARSGIHVIRRPGGGVIVTLVAARPEDVIPLAELYLGLRLLPESPVWLESRPPE
jgi:hypothetical protein